MKRSDRFGWSSKDITIEPPKKTSVQKDAKEDKVAVVMREFANGKLKSSSGKPVTDKNQALAIAMSAAGISKKSLQKAEMLSQARVIKSELHAMIRKEMTNDKDLKQSLIDYFKGNPNPKDTEVHAIAQKFGVDPSEAEQVVYRILAEFFVGGTSRGKKLPVDPKEFRMGMEVEKEHTAEPAMVEKIVRDHLAEDPKYYSKLKVMEDGETGDAKTS